MKVGQTQNTDFLTLLAAFLWLFATKPRTQSGASGAFTLAFTKKCETKLRSPSEYQRISDKNLLTISGNGLTRRTAFFTFFNLTLPPPPPPPHTM
jgi:hypothetical protein